MDTLLFSFSVNCAVDSVGEKFLQDEPGKCNNLSHGNLMKIQSFIKITKKTKQKKTKLPCLSVSVSGLVVGKGIQL